MEVEFETYLYLPEIDYVADFFLKIINNYTTQPVTSYL